MKNKHSPHRCRVKQIGKNVQKEYVRTSQEDCIFSEEDKQCFQKLES